MTYKEILSEAGEDEKSRKSVQRTASSPNLQRQGAKEFWPIYEDESCVIGPLNSIFTWQTYLPYEKIQVRKKLTNTCSINMLKYWKTTFLVIKKEDAVPVSLLKQQIRD